MPPHQQSLSLLPLLLTGRESGKQAGIGPQGPTPHRPCPGVAPPRAGRRAREGQGDSLLSWALAVASWPMGGFPGSLAERKTTGAQAAGFSPRTFLLCSALLAATAASLLQACPSGLQARVQVNAVRPQAEPALPAPWPRSPSGSRGGRWTRAAAVLHALNLTTGLSGALLSWTPVQPPMVREGRAPQTLG